MEDSKKTQIKDFPNDNILRVIYGYGPLIKNSISSVPLVEIYSKKLINNKLSKDTEEFKVGLTELNVVRIGSIWQGQIKKEEYWTDFPNYKYSDKLSFSFDMEECSISTVVHLNKGTTSFFTDIDNLHDGENIHHSTLTLLQADNGIRVLIPSLELFSSTYTPRHARLKIDLVSNPIEAILEKYVKSSACEDNKYIVELDSGHYYETIVFLANLSLNETVRKNVSKLWASLESGVKKNENGLIKSYPIVNPYPSSKFSFKASGLWFDKNTFLVQRIDSFKTLNDYKIIVKRKVQEVFDVEQKNKNTKNSTGVNKTPVSEETPVSSEVDPGYSAGRKNIISEVEVDNSEVDIQYENEIIEVDDIEKPKVQPSENAELASSGYLSGSDKSKKVAQVAYIGYEELQYSKERVATLKLIEDILQSLIKDKIIKEVRYIDRAGEEYENIIYCLYEPSFLKKQRKKSWVYASPTNRSKSRRILIAKIFLTSSSQVLYLLEIERRKNSSESFYGIFFYLENNIDFETVNKIMKYIAKNRGHLSGKKRKEEFPISKYWLLRHEKDKDIMKRKIEKALDLFEKNELFL